MFSFDVISLFTNIPTEMVLEGIRHLLATDPSLNERTMLPTKIIMNLVDLRLETHLQFDGKICKQLMDPPIGSLLSSLLAKGAVKPFEIKALEALRPHL